MSIGHASPDCRDHRTLPHGRCLPQVEPSGAGDPRLRIEGSVLGWRLLNVSRVDISAACGMVCSARLRPREQVLPAPAPGHVSVKGPLTQSVTAEDAVTWSVDSGRRIETRLTSGPNALTTRPEKRVDGLSRHG
jgi:hypothetical protein